MLPEQPDIIFMIFFSLIKFCIFVWGVNALSMGAYMGMKCVECVHRQHFLREYKPNKSSLH